MKRVIVLIDENGTKTVIDIDRENFVSLFNLIKQANIEQIAVGEVDQVDGVMWEKQFKAITVMPSDFGKQQKHN